MLKSALEMKIPQLLAMGKREDHEGSCTYVLFDKWSLELKTAGRDFNGPFTLYYPNGVPAVKGLLDHGDRVGEWEYFTPEGDIGLRP